MELHQLKIFARVVQDGSFSRAAQALHLTQPAVSQQIRALEQELGVALLHRTNRDIRPTRAGEVLLEYAQGLLTLAERGRAALAEFQAERRGRLILGAGNTTITFRLPKLLREYRRREPGVEVIVRAGTSHVLLNLLEQGQLDVAMVTSLPAGRSFRSIPLYRDEIVMILPGDHPLGHAESLTPADLALVPSILFARGSGYRRFLDESFTRAGYQPDVVMELDSIEGIKQLVQSGLGLSFLPKIAVEQELSQGLLRVVPVVGLTPTSRTTHVVFRREQFPAAPLTVFLDLLEGFYGNSLQGYQDETNHQRHETSVPG
ncbi:MAG: LysR substrate-binding domain-containing protein [Bacteroidota bacterium]